MSFATDQKERLGKLGEVIYYKERAETPEEWLMRVKGFDVICTGVFGIREKWAELQNTFVSLPFVGVGWADPAVLKVNHAIMSNSPGCNRHAVSEWIIGMLLVIARKLDKYIDIKELPVGHLMTNPDFGLAGKNMTILGQGHIGSRVGEIAKAFEMNVTFFKRGDDLHEKVANADVVVDTLSVKADSKGLLGKSFFEALKDGAIFISVSAEPILDVDAMLAALDSGKLAYAATDAQRPGDTLDPLYQKLLNHPKIYVTPHVAWNTDVERRMANDMMIDNIEAWLKGKPQNVVV